ncbi:MAG: fumarylacetoacetate hydrolase family protein [Burkholderiales bacterium]|nr:fumarylacetoacetate hydrolase family protein [Burkholderiales bacterium]
MHRDDGLPTRWVRFDRQGHRGFGVLHDDDSVQAYRGDLFGDKQPTGERLALGELSLMTPSEPTKVIALWNNFHALARKLELPTPAEPLYLLKAPNSYLPANQPIRVPACPGKVAFEGELGIVIGKTCCAVPEAQALDHVFGYTCANDVTVTDILHRDASFAQWARAKGFDTFCPMGPVVASGLDPTTLQVSTRLDGQLRQHYPISDMRFSVAQLVSMISFDMTLQPGDVILCGTSVGVGSMKPNSIVEVEIGGIGKLRNRFE